MTVNGVLRDHAHGGHPSASTTRRRSQERDHSWDPRGVVEKRQLGIVANNRKTAKRRAAGVGLVAVIALSLTLVFVGGRQKGDWVMQDKMIEEISNTVVNGGGTDLPPYERIEVAEGLVITRDKKGVDQKLMNMRRGGPDKLQIISDFDMTLTSFLMVDGSRTASTHGILERSGLFGAKFEDEAQKRFEKYYPIEVDPVLDKKVKLAKMEEWWKATHQAIVDVGIVHHADLEKCVREGHFAFRKGVTQLFDTLHDLHIPILIFSAGIANIVEEVFKQYMPETPVNVISNRMVFSEKGFVVDFEPKGKPIHVLNKGKVGLVGTPHHELVKGRSNVVLLGDSLGDLHMAAGLEDTETVLSVGFLNDKVNERLGQFLRNFDVVVMNDGPMSAVSDILDKVLHKSETASSGPDLGVSDDSRRSGQLSSGETSKGRLSGEEETLTGGKGGLESSSEEEDEGSDDVKKLEKIRKLTYDGDGVGGELGGEPASSKDDEDVDLVEEYLQEGNLDLDWEVEGLPGRGGGLKDGGDGEGGEEVWR